MPEPNILNLSFVYSEGEKIISFPVWFNDSLVRERGITSIERVFYYESGDSTENESEEDVTPEKKITYLFDKNGFPKEMQVGNYYDNRLISSLTVKYSEYKPKTGFAKVTMNEKISTEDFPYVEFRQLSASNHLYSYKDLFSSDRLLIIPDSKNWKPLVVDTLCKPGKGDLIVWGSLKHPQKIYSVQNLVEESNVREFTYEHGVLKRVEWTDDPFKIHRTFRFNKEGICTGFADSTFSMGGFVAAANYFFELNNQLPVQVTKEVNRGGAKRIIFRESFTYHFNN